MDYKDSKRKTKKDKAKETRKRNGEKSTKHTRIVVELLEKKRK